MRSLIDLTGKRFGRLTVLSRAEDYVSPTGKTLLQWLCRCDCGNEVTVYGQYLRSGHTKSCGCLKHEGAHKMSETRLYRIYHDMKTRCHYPSHRSYAQYGGRGIKICDEWDNSFESFMSWAMENGYSDSLSIDRIDSNGNYEPANCRWVNAVVQGNNTSRNVFLEYGGRKQTIAQWNKEMGFNRKLIGSRLAQGWSVEEAISTPVNNKRGTA